MFSCKSITVESRRPRSASRREAALSPAIARALRPGVLVAALLVVAAPLSPVQAQGGPPTFSKSFAPDTIGPGSVTTLRFDIVNTGGGSPVRELAFVDNLPAAVTIASPAKASTTCGAASLDAPAGGGTVAFANGGVGAGGSCFVRVDVTSATPGTHTNVSGDLTSDAGNSGNATADLAVATDRPGFAKSFAPPTVFFGGRSTLSFTIDNSANASGAANLTFTDSLPPGMVVASPANASTTCGGGVITAPAGGGAISYGPQIFPDATVGAGATCTVSVDVLGNAVGALGNTSDELTSTPPLGGVTRSSGKAGAVLTVTFEQIALLKRFTDDPVPPGDTVTLEFTAFNFNRDFSATAITFSDDLGAVLAGLEAIGLPATDVCGAGSQLAGTDVVTLIGGELPPEGSCTFSVTLQVPAGAPTGSFTNTTSTIEADIDGRPFTGSAATDLLFVQPVPRLTKEFTDDPAGAGGSVTLEFTITNTSADQSATGIAFVDDFATILPTASSVPASGFCGAGSTAVFTPRTTNPARLTVSNASLAPGASCTFSITLDVAVGARSGVFPNVTSAITATVGGQTFTGDPASDDLVVVGTPVLSKAFIGDPVAPGDTVILRFTLLHDENGPGNATDITFTDDLDAALSGLVATGLPATDVCGIGSSIAGTMTLTFAGGTLAPGEGCSFDVTLQVPSDAPVGGHTNVTSAVVATVLGVQAIGDPATDVLRIAGLELTKEFVDDPAIAGGTVTLRFAIVNQSQLSPASAIFFIDDLDAALAGLNAVGLPLADVCGAGSSLVGSAGDTRLTFQNGSLAAGASCTFDVVLQIPAGTPDDTYVNLTAGFRATVEGETVLFDNASDRLVVSSDFLILEKEFLDDPVSPGDPVTLRFTITNLSPTETVADIFFTDDLDAALTGLAATGLPALDVCGAGSSIDGTGLLTLMDGTLGPAGSCVIDVTLAVPATAPLGSVATNVTSTVSGTVDGFKITGDPATDDLTIDFIRFVKSFSGDASPGGVVTLEFTIENLSEVEGVTELAFSDNLGIVLPGLEAIGLPQSDVCGEGSVLAGVSFLTFSGGSLLPGGSCTFAVDVQVPEEAEPGSYLNVTSDLLAAGLPVAAPATAVLTVVAVADDDEDGVLDGDDVCPDTVIPEGVPTHGLRPNRYALIDEDFIFDTINPPGGGPGDVFTTTDTAGCSCEQIIEALGLGQGHVRHGCSLGAMRTWVRLVSGEGLALRAPAPPPAADGR